MLPSVLPCIEGEVPETDKSSECGQKAEAIARGLAALGLLNAWEVQATPNGDNLGLTFMRKVDFDKDGWRLAIGRISSPTPLVNNDSLWGPATATYLDQHFNQGAAAGASDLTYVKATAVKGGLIGFSSKWRTKLRLGQLDIEKIMVSRRLVPRFARLGQSKVHKIY